MLKRQKRGGRVKIENDVDASITRTRNILKRVKKDSLQQPVTAQPVIINKRKNSRRVKFVDSVGHREKIKKTKKETST